MTMTSGVSTDKEFSLKKIRNLIRSADQIIFGSFPYDDSRKALVQIREVFRDLEADLVNLD
jgi:hypothetical protein